MTSLSWLRKRLTQEEGYARQGSPIGLKRESTCQEKKGKKILTTLGWYQLKLKTFNDKFITAEFFVEQSNVIIYHCWGSKLTLVLIKFKTTETAIWKKWFGSCGIKLNGRFI